MNKTVKNLLIIGATGAAVYLLAKLAWFLMPLAVIGGAAYWYLTKD